MKCVAFVLSTWILCVVSCCEIQEEITLKSDGVKSYDCLLDDDYYMNMLSLTVKPAVGHISDEFKVLHYSDEQCVNRTEYELNSSCNTTTPFCGRFDVPVDGSDDSCIEIQCLTVSGCTLDVEIFYRDEYDIGIPPLRRDIAIERHAYCSMFEYGYGIASGAWIMLYCSAHDGLNDRAKLDFHVESTNGHDEITVYRIQSQSSCNKDPATIFSDTGDNVFDREASCGPGVNLCERSDLEVDVSYRKSGECIMIKCENDMNNCVLDIEISYAAEFMFFGTLRISGETSPPEGLYCLYLHYVDFSAVDTEKRYYCKGERMEVEDDFLMDIHQSEGTGKFRVYHSSGSSCDLPTSHNSFHEIKDSSCSDRDVTDCTFNGDVVDSYECVIIKCMSANPANCRLDVYLQWSSSNKSFLDQLILILMCWITLNLMC